MVHRITDSPDTPQFKENLRIIRLQLIEDVIPIFQLRNS
ncbi:hypothetical protein CCP3SC5AM1_1880004 [Gammaproteobacteria bacterium]